MTGEVHLDTAGGVFGGERREIAEKCSKHGLATTCGQPNERSFRWKVQENE